MQASGQKNAQETKDPKFITMTETPVKKLILKLAIPTMVSMMITSVYNMADTFFVGQISTGSAEATSATAAVGLAFPLMAIIQAFGFMFGQGSGNFISRALGSQKTDEAERMAATGFFMALIADTLLMTLGLLFLHPLVILLGSTETTFYVLSVYFGAAGVKKSRHAVPAALCADAAGFLAAAWAVRLFF